MVDKQQVVRAISKLANLLMTDERINWAGIYLGERGTIKLAIYHAGEMSLTELTEMVHRLGGPALKFLLTVPGFGAKKVSPRTTFGRWI
jgi:hypothetical protein